MQVAGVYYRSVVSIFLIIPVLAGGCASSQVWKSAVSPLSLQFDVFHRPRSHQEPINFVRLGQNPPPEHILGPRDTLGIYIEGVLGKPDEAPPVHYPEKGNLPPALGFPIPVRENGTIALPLVPPINVEGLTLAQAEAKIRKAYTVDRRILRGGRDRILVTLMRPRTYQILVIREDTTNPGVSARRSERGELTIGSDRRGAMHLVELPAYENDVLHALAESGGLPGLDAKNQVTILRRGFDPAGRLGTHLRSPFPEVGDVFVPHVGYHEEGDTNVHPAAFIDVADDSLFLPPRVLPPRTPEIPELLTPDLTNPNVIRIPLRVAPGEPIPELTQDDIILNTGDVVFIESREAEVFYTGGLLRGGQFPIPRDYDLDVLGAIAMSGGSIAAAAGGSVTAGGQLRGGIGSIFPPSRLIILRQLEDGQQIIIGLTITDALMDPRQRVLIQPEDLILLEYTPFEVVMNVILNNLQVNLSLNQLF